MWLPIEAEIDTDVKGVYSFSPAGAYRRPGVGVKERALAVYTGESSLSAIGRVLGYSTQAVNWNEGLHSVWRDKLNRLARRTKGYTKSVEMLAHSLALVCWQQEEKLNAYPRWEYHTFLTLVLPYASLATGRKPGWPGGRRGPPVADRGGKSGLLRTGCWVTPRLRPASGGSGTESGTETYRREPDGSGKGEIGR